MKDNPDMMMCPYALDAVENMHFDSKIQWGACVAASNTCKYTVGIFGVDCDVELMTVEQRFKALDTNKDGQLSQAEVMSVLQLDHKLSDRSLIQLQDWHQQHDLDQSGTLSLIEYHKTWNRDASTEEPAPVDPRENNLEI